MSEDLQKPKEQDLLEKIKKIFEEKALSWGVPGAVLGLALHFAKEQKWSVVIALVAVAGLTALLLRFFSKLTPHLDKLFEWLANNFAGWVQRSWWKMTAQFQGRYYELLIYACRDFRTQGLKTKGPFTLDFEKVFVPLRVAPESADLATAAMLQGRGKTEGLMIWDFLARLKKQPAYRRIVVIAPPGAGKSTLLEHLALTYAKNTQGRRNRRVPRLIPILLYLRDVRGKISGEYPPDLTTLIEQQESIQTLNPKGWFKSNLDRGKCLVMLDGLDEVADEGQRQKVSRWVDRQMELYPKTPFILTSRPFGYRSAPLNQVGTVLEVKPFSLREMRQFVNNWYLQNELMSRLGKDDPGVREKAKQQAEDLIKRIQETPTLAAMALNPLLLTMIATVHRFRGALPGRRVELYHEICDVLLGRRQDAKKITDSMSAMQKKAVLQVLALGLMKQNTREFTPALGAQLIQAKLRSIMGKKADATQFLKQIENTTGLLAEREQGVYEFAHKSFQEYLAAVELTDSTQADILTEKIQDAWWDETIRLYAAQTDATHLVKAALQNPTITSLTLAYDCVEEGLSIEPEVRQALETKLDVGLESPDSDLFKLTAEVKLARRLNRLIRIDEKTEIDNSLITCAEYQLFIEEKRNNRENRQPDHWRSYQFPQGDAAKPILGVRASDAEEFCQWLADRGTAQYRLATSVEAENHPISTQDVGYWGWVGDSKSIVGITFQQWISLSQRLLSVLDRILDQPLNFDLYFDLDLVLDLDLDRTCARTLDLKGPLDLKGTLDLDLALARDLGRDLACDLALDRAHNLDLALTLARDLFLYRAINRAINRAALDLNSWNIFSSKRILSLVFVFAVLWDLLSKTYAETAQKQPRVWFKTSKRKDWEKQSQEFTQRRDAALRIYRFIVLVVERQAGNLPAWEGIRIVRERIED
jgi:predicted NACHT family NTPase